MKLHFSLLLQAPCMTEYFHSHSHSGIQANTHPGDAPLRAWGLCKSNTIEKEWRIVHRSFGSEKPESDRLYFDHNSVARTSHMALPNVRGLKI